MRKHLFCIPFLFGIKTQLKNNVFSKPLFGPNFSHFMLIGFEKYTLGTPFKIQRAPKWHPKSIKWPKNINKSSQGMKCSRSWKQLASKRSPETPKVSFCMICGGLLALILAWRFSKSQPGQSDNTTKRNYRKLATNFKKSANKNRSPRNSSRHLAISETMSSHQTAGY